MRAKVSGLTFLSFVSSVTNSRSALRKQRKHWHERVGSCSTQPETTPKRSRLWMTRCTPCVLCGTHHKLIIVYRIAVRLPRSSHRCCAIPFLGSACRHVLPASLFAHVVEK